MCSNTIKVFGSGSDGNCIAIYDSRGKYILLDAGIKYSQILKGVNYDISSCIGVFATHHHSDHVKSLEHFIYNGVPCFSNSDVCSLFVGCNDIKNKVTIDGFKVQTFNLVHDVPCNAFVIDTIDGVRVLYCTDTQYIPKVVKGVNYAIIECNHDKDDMLDNEMNDVVSQSQYNNHQDVDRCITYLKKIYNVNLQCVILFHMSNTNISPIRALKRVKEELSYNNVEIARKGLEIRLSNSEF